MRGRVAGIVRDKRTLEEGKEAAPDDISKTDIERPVNNVSVLVFPS
jgi:hypothetical protein